MKIHEMDVTSDDGHYVYRLGDLRIKTDSWERRGADAVLGIGGSKRGSAPMLLNYMLNHPDIVAGKRVFEPFAGAGPNGLLALVLGAESSDLLEISPRAVGFLRDSARMSGLESSRCRIIEGDMAGFQPAAPYDIIFANPPFVPTPPNMTGVLHSNGGPDGCLATRSLLAKLEQLLIPEGQAMIWSLQIEAGHIPILASDLRRAVPGRPVEMMRTTDCDIDFNRLVGCLVAEAPAHTEEVLEWRSDLRALHGGHLTLNWYLIHIGPQDPARAELVVTDFDATRYGAIYGPGPMDHRRRIQRLVELEVLR